MHGHAAPAGHARVEGRRLLVHPIFVLGISYSVFEAVVFARQDAHTAVQRLADGFVWIGVAAAFLVAFVARSREQRDDAQDTYAAQPATPRLRTEAALLSIGFAGLAGAALVMLVVTGLGGLDGEIVIHDEGAAVRPLELAHGPLYLMLGGALGVLVGSWTQRLPVAALGALVLFAPPALLSRSLATVDTMAGGVFGVVVPDAAGAPRVVALLALIALAAAGALARHDRRRHVGALAIAAIATLVILLWPQLSDDRCDTGEIAC